VTYAPNTSGGGGGGGGLTNAELRATPVDVITQEPISVDDNGGSLTVDGTIAVSNFPATQPVSGTVDTKTDLTPSAPTSASVGVASAQAVAANGSRKGLVLVNVSNNRISFGLGAAAVLDSGITLYPGGVWEMDEYTFDLGAVNAIASAAASTLAIQEFA
jgi:hypothetical protein